MGFRSSKLAVSSVRSSVRDLLAEANGEKKRKLVETAELRIGLKGRVSQHDERHSVIVKCVASALKCGRLMLAADP